MQFRLKTLEKTFHLGAQSIDAIGNAARFREDSAAYFRQLRCARRLAIEQRDAKLRLQIGNRIADHRSRTSELSRRAGEAANIHHGQKDLQLIQCWRPGGGWHIEFLERNGRNNPSFADR
jgi:hypothetical protein